MEDPLSRIRSFPRNPLHDVSSVRGNVSDEQKQLNLNTLHYFTHGGFGNEGVRGLRLVEANVHPVRIGGDGGRVQGETVCEIEVSEAMLNRFGTVAGACVVHLLDITTFSALYAHGFKLGADFTGVSCAMDIQWHSPARRGMTLSIVSTSMNVEGRLCASRGEVYDKKTGRLLASVVHSIAPLKRMSTKL